MKRSKQQWLELIRARQASNLFIIDFCHEEELPLNKFYARRSDWLKFKRIKTNVNSFTFSEVTVAEASKYPKNGNHPQHRQSNLIYSMFNRRGLASEINWATRMKMFVDAA
jgi:hypothetical protein